MRCLRLGCADAGAAGGRTERREPREPNNPSFPASSARPADVLSEDADGSLVLDLTKFHDLVPTEPMPDFPYPAA